MTDQFDPTDDDQEPMPVTDATDVTLSPAQDADVRRLLAAARVRDPMPADVVARLDGVLADLRQPARTDELAARRRRRRATQLLVAAAAVVATGFGIGPLLLRSGDAALSTADSDAGPAAMEAAPDDKGGSSAGDAGAATAPQANESQITGSDPKDLSAGAAQPLVRVSDLAGDVLELVATARTDLRLKGRSDFLPYAAETRTHPSPAPSLDPLGGESAASACVLPPRFHDRLRLPVSLLDEAGVPEAAVILMGPRDLGSRRAQVWVCGEVFARHMVALPAP
ncbi:MAG: hypothetical protein WAW88_10715 [Nocardioides sp.]